METFNSFKSDPFSEQPLLTLFHLGNGFLVNSFICLLEAYLQCQL